MTIVVSIGAHAWRLTQLYTVITDDVSDRMAKRIREDFVCKHLTTNNNHSCNNFNSSPSPKHARARVVGIASLFE